MQGYNYLLWMSVYIKTSSFPLIDYSYIVEFLSDKQKLEELF